MLLPDPSLMELPGKRRKEEKERKGISAGSAAVAQIGGRIILDIHGAIMEGMAFARTHARTHTHTHAHTRSPALFF